MTSNIHAIRIALGGGVVLAAALATSACGSEQGVDPDPTSVVGAPKSEPGPATSSPCSSTADQVQRQIDAGLSTDCDHTDRSPGGQGGRIRPFDYGAEAGTHHPL
jgi:hypothetical protein